MSHIPTRAFAVAFCAAACVATPALADNASPAAAAINAATVVADPAPTPLPPEVPAVVLEDAGAAKFSLGGGKEAVAAVAEPPQTPPAGTPTLPDPVDSPGGFLSGVKDLAQKGWPLALVVGLFAVATALRKRVSWFSEPGTKRAAITAGAVSVLGLLAARLADVPGIHWVDVFVGVATAIAYAMHSTTQQKV